MQPSAFYQAWLGHIVKLVVQRIGPPGAYLSAGESDPKGKVSAILLPGAEVPRDVKPGSELEVFVYLDSEDRPIATLRPPKLLLGEVAFLDVTDKASFGAFVDWGMPKELLVPTAEQTCPLSIGNRQPIALYIDASGRLAGTMRVSEKLSKKPPYEVDQWVKGEAWRNDPRIGLFVILERRFVGLVPAQEPHSLKRGETAFFRVATVLEDGKVTLSLRRHALDE
ncbi:MAG: nucleic acid-binding protein, partial [Sorangium cellulosum]